MAVYRLTQTDFPYDTPAIESEYSASSTSLSTAGSDRELVQGRRKE